LKFEWVTLQGNGDSKGTGNVIWRAYQI